MLRKSLILTIVLALSALHPACADEATEAALRDALQSTTAQLHTLQDQQAQMAAEDAQLRQQNAQMLVQLSTRPAAGPAASPADAGAAKALAAKNAELAKLAAQAAQLQEADTTAAAQNQQLRTSAATLTAQLHALSQSAQACNAANEKLVGIGNDILDKYAHMTVREVLADRDPFIGIARVKLENQLQTYRDGLMDETLAP
jgi:hypothetical protein